MHQNKEGTLFNVYSSELGHQNVTFLIFLCIKRKGLKVKKISQNFLKIPCLTQNGKVPSMEAVISFHALFCQTVWEFRKRVHGRGENNILLIKLNTCLINIRHIS